MFGWIFGDDFEVGKRPKFQDFFGEFKHVRNNNSFA